MGNKKYRRKKKIIDPLQVSCEWGSGDRNRSWEKLWDQLGLFLSQKLNEEDSDDRK